MKEARLQLTWGGYTFLSLGTVTWHNTYAPPGRGPGLAKLLLTSKTPSVAPAILGPRRSPPDPYRHVRTVSVPRWALWPPFPVCFLPVPGLLVPGLCCLSPSYPSGSHSRRRSSYRATLKSSTLARWYRSSASVYCGRCFLFANLNILFAAPVALSR